MTFETLVGLIITAVVIYGAYRLIKRDVQEDAPRKTRGYYDNKIDKRKQK